MDEVEPTMKKVTCHTEGCPVNGITYTVPMYPNAAPPVWRAQCGQCNQPVTDIQPADG
jgi:hypothetical protein